jgi:hypothetical protein
MTTMWRQVPEGYRSECGHDGSAHITFYDAHRLLSFTWDGRAEWIEVHHGGYGEPVEWIIPAFAFKGYPDEVLTAFEDHCRSMIPEWDSTIWDDEEFTYSEVYPHCGIAEKHVPVPKGRAIHFYNREKPGMDKRIA